MYDFYYNDLKKKHDSKLKLQMSDIDLFLYHVQTDDLYLDTCKSAVWTRLFVLIFFQSF